jgi:NitT/TauT family transport system substrate-binding protein
MNTKHAILSLLLAATCLLTAQAQRPVRITVQLDWVAEPEHGGFYQAQEKGFFREAGLDVTLVPGGANANVFRRVGANEAQFGQSDSTNVLLAINNGLPVLMVGAVFQNDPSVLMLHDTNPISGFEELNGRTIMARPEWAFLPYLKKKYGIDFSVIPQNFNLGMFINDPGFIQQGFYIAEPYHILKQSEGKVRPKYLYAWDAGFDAYTVLIGNTRWMRNNPDATRRFLDAYIRGWRDYIEGDPTAAHAAMIAANPAISQEFCDFSRRMIIDERLVIGREGGGPAMIGRIDPARFAIQIAQLEELGILPKGKLQPARVMTTDYLPPATE